MVVVSDHKEQPVDTAEQSFDSVKCSPKLIVKISVKGAETQFRSIPFGGSKI